MIGVVLTGAKGAGIDRDFDLPAGFPFLGDFIRPELQTLVKGRLARRISFQPSWDEPQ
jgi:hypothetical protein